MLHLNLVLYSASYLWMSALNLNTGCYLPNVPNMAASLGYRSTTTADDLGPNSLRLPLTRSKLSMSNPRSSL